jgi:ATP-dependent DNA helicase RecG
MNTFNASPAELTLALAAESPRVEWKHSRKNTDEILRAACAFANDLAGSGQPGYLVIGIDKSGRVVGEDTSDQTIQNLVSRLTSTRILPTPSCTVESAKHEGKNLLVVRVQPYPVPPVVKVDGVAWVRVGTTTRRATEADLVRLQERRPESRIAFDARPCHGASLDDLDLALLRMSYAADRGADQDVDTFPEFDAWLGQGELARHTAAGWTPTNAGVLVHGISPQTYFPGAIIEFVRYAGTDIDGPVTSRKTVSGRLVDQLEAIWAQVQANLAEVPAPGTGIRSPYVSEYPLEALKELARNLVQHRLYEATNAPGRVSWFDDRIEFTNPGRPYGQASEGEFGAHSDYRNPSITGLLVKLGYVERLGRGIRRVRKQLVDNGNPGLEAETDGFTTVCVRRRP